MSNSKTNSKRNAFPATVTREWQDSANCPDGLTKREYFAALLMQAIVSTDDYQCVFFAVGESQNNPEKAAVRMADALLLELEK